MLIRRFILAVFATLALAGAARAQGDEDVTTFYRRVSDWEKRKVLKTGELFVTPGSGETFVSTSREYVDQLGARHPKDYANLLVITVEKATLRALEKLGLRSSGGLLDRMYPDMPIMEKDRPDAVHFKAEKGALNLGLRTGSIENFNEYIKSIKVDETARLTVPKDATSIKDRFRRGSERGKTTGVTDVLDTRMRDAKDGERDRER
jgi:hypothetical protein